MAELPPPTLSVVTPSRNQGRFLARTLASVALQDYPALEHQVIDGASTDETLDVLRAAARPGLSWVSESDRGQAHAVNKGIARSRGEIIAWINSDDVYLAHAFATVARFFLAHPEVDVVYGQADRIDADDRTLAPYPTAPFDPLRLHDVVLICQPAAFFRRRCVERFGMLDERLKYCMDYEFWLRLARGGARFAYLPARLAASRLHRDTETQGARVAGHREIIDMFLRLQGRVPTNWLLGYAGALVGRHLDRQRHPRGYAAAAAAGSVLAALRWNHTLPWDLPALARAQWARARSGGADGADA
jgi:glycosyltransferase involved in cell wall biosynthesis